MYVPVRITVISVDLTDSRMAPGGRGYQRLLTGLKSRLQLKTDFLLSHYPGERDVIIEWFNPVCKLTPPLLKLAAVSTQLTKAKNVCFQLNRLTGSHSITHNHLLFVL